MKRVTLNFSDIKSITPLADCDSHLITNCRAPKHPFHVAVLFSVFNSGVSFFSLIGHFENKKHLYFVSCFIDLVYFVSYSKVLLCFDILFKLIFYRSLANSFK